MRRAAVLAAVAFVVLAAPAGGDEIDLAAWQARLADGDPAVIAATTAVVLPDGTRQRVSESALTALPPAAQRARIATLRAAADDLAARTADTADVVAAARSAAARPEFDEIERQRRRYRLPGWLQSAVEAIGRFLRRLFDGVASPDLTTGQGIFQLLLAIGLAALIGVFAVRLLRRGTAVGPPDIADPAESAVDEPSEDVWRRRAAAARAAGDRAEALRCLYLAALLHLDRRAIVDFRPGRTDALYALELADAAPAALEPFRRLADEFSRSHYGGEDVDDLALARAEQAEAELRDVVRRRAA